MKVNPILESIEKGKGTHEFIPTGFPSLDRNLDGGFLRRELVVLGGETGAGKSYLAIHLAMNAAHAGFKVGYFSLEISNELVVARMIGMRSGVKASHILYDLGNPGDIELLKAKAFVQGLHDVFESEDETYELPDIEEKIKASKYDFVIIDFVQNVLGSRPDEYERLSYVSLHLQRIAKQENTCVLVLSQLSNVVSRSDVNDRPLEYKGSGSIATVADLGFFLARVKVDPQIVIDENITDYQLRLAKNRRGPSNLFTTLQVRWPGGAFYEKA